MERPQKHHVRYSGGTKFSRIEPANKRIDDQKVDPVKLQETMDSLEQFENHKKFTKETQKYT